MTEKEILALIAVNKSNFPTAYRDMKDEEVLALVDTWLYQFGSYPAEVIQHAFMSALRYCKFPVTIADVFGEIKKIKSAGQKSTEELWIELSVAADKCYDLSKGFHYNFIEENGLQQGENFRNRAKNIFANMDYVNREYCGNLYRLIDMGEMESVDRERFILPAYRRQVEQIRERGEVMENTPRQILSVLGFDLEGVKSMPKLTEG